MNGHPFQIDKELASLLKEQLVQHYDGHEPMFVGSGFLSAAHEVALRPILEHLIDPLGLVHTHLSIKTATSPTTDHDRRWHRPFPHQHDWDDSYTVILFLTDLPDGGGEFVWFEGDKERLVAPQVGLAVACDGKTKHGVLKVKGAGTRIALLTTGWKVGSHPPHFK